MNEKQKRIAKVVIRCVSTVIGLTISEIIYQASTKEKDIPILIEAVESESE